MYPITSSVDYNLRLKRLDTQLNEAANQNSRKVPKVIKLTNKNMLLKSLWTSVINSPMSPLSMITSLKLHFINN